MRIAVGVLAVSLLVGTATPVVAASSEPPQPPLSAHTASEFVEEIVPAQLKRHQIPGAAVTVVARGEQVFANGYGFAEVTSGRAVDVEQTAFAPASVAKLLTATAVMQLVEDGKIDLNADVNAYLDFEIDDIYPCRPITTDHLLTHTAGFAVRDSGTAAATPHDIDPLGAHLANHLPERIRPPGQRAVYSNYGMGLAGYLVERRSGMPFHQYVDQNILRPLGMHRTTFAQPTPQHIQRNEAIGYRLAQGRHIPAEGAVYGHMPPHGAGFRSTATDMARFMRAMLNGGAGILQPDSVQRMQRRQFGNMPGTPGMGYGFQEYPHGDQRLLVHRGAIPGSFAILALIPEHDIGLYASYNGGDGTAADSVWNLVDAFTNRFVPTTPHEKRHQDGPLADPSQYAGTYSATQIADTADLGKLAGLFNTVTVTNEPNGQLRTTGPAALGPTQPRRWEPVGPGLFREQNGRQTIQFGQDGLLTTADPTQPLQRLAWHEHPNLHLAVLGTSLLILLTAAFAWPIIRVIRRLRNRPRRAPGFAALPGWITAILTLGSAATLFAMFADFERNQAAFFHGSSPLLTAIGTLPLLGAVATISAAATTTIAWKNTWWTRTGRIHHTAVVLAAAAYLTLIFIYNVPSAS